MDSFDNTKDWEKYRRKIGYGEYYGEDSTVIAKYGMFYIRGNSFPYFSITGDVIKGRKTWDYLESRQWALADRQYLATGCVHDPIVQAMPEFAELVPWHLCAATGVPMYYLENSLYWWRERNWDHFESTAKVLPEEKELYPKDAAELVKWLLERRSSVANRFYSVLEKWEIPGVIRCTDDELYTLIAKE